MANSTHNLPDDRRSEHRHSVDPLCRAIVRISGIPVYEFRMKDVSRNGTCFIVEEDSAVLRHLKIGQELEIRYQFPDASKSAVLYRSQVRHITRADPDSLQGQYYVGVKIITQLSIP